MSIGNFGFSDYQNSYVGTNTIDGAKQLAQSQSDAALRILNQEVVLTVGQTFSGEVKNADGNEIQLLLQDGKTLTAKMEQGISLEPGQKLSFEVKSNAKNQISIRPLYANLSHNQTAINALKGAGLTVTNSNLNMVNTMMQEGMSVNRQALFEMLKNLNANPQAPVENMIALKKLEIPITPQNLSQYENYQNFKHQILGDVKELTQGLVELATESFVQNTEQADLSTLKQVFAMLPEEAMWQKDSLKVPGDGAENSNGEQTEAAVYEAGTRETAVMTQNSQGMQGTFEKITFFEEQLKQLEVPEAEREVILSGDIPKNIVYYLKAAFTGANQIDFSQLSGEKKQALSALLANEDILGKFRSELENLFTLKPQELVKEGKMKELYRQIMEQSNRAMEILNESGKENPALMKSAQSLQDNVQFMEQLNHVMTYIQLPLKMTEQNAHGELYVYTNKKNLAKKDGNVSALLHLDMEALGPMDVYVAMQQQKVNTHFYMQDDDTLSFIEKNLHILDERLAKKGYQMNTQATTKSKEDRESITDTFFKEQEGSVSTKQVSKLSFDVRA